MASYQNIFVHACDFSPRAVDLIKVCSMILFYYRIIVSCLGKIQVIFRCTTCLFMQAHKDFREDRLNVFPCDLTVDKLDANILPYSVDIVIMVSPDILIMIVQFFFQLVHHIS